MKINGQWFGNIAGTNNGIFILNLDYIEGRYQGYIYLYDQFPYIVARISIDCVKNNKFNGNLFEFYVLNDEQCPLTPNETPSELILPKDGSCEFVLTNDNKLVGKWNTDIGTNGNFSADKAQEYTNNDAYTMSWTQFKSEIKENGKYWYRGQPNIFKLRTSYHRSGRADLVRYNLCDVRNFHNEYSNGGEDFDLRVDVEYLSLLYLAQHYGKDTPLLDWTRSPYIAAYFAFYKKTESEYVTIFQFDQVKWLYDNNIQVKYIQFPLPSLTLLEPRPSDTNKRALPQKSVSMFSTIDDIQTFITRREAELKTKYLKVVKIAATEREKVLIDLELMGINNASLLPD